MLSRGPIGFRAHVKSALGESATGSEPYAMKLIFRTPRAGLFVQALLPMTLWHLCAVLKQTAMTTRSTSTERCTDYSFSLDGPCFMALRMVATEATLIVIELAWRKCFDKGVAFCRISARPLNPEGSEGSCAGELRPSENTSTTRPLM